MNTKHTPECQPVYAGEWALNDATVLGELDDSFLSREITIAASPHGMKTKPGSWKNMKIKVGALLNTLTHHRSGEKDGHCILQGEVIEGERKATAIKQNSILMLDLDTGEHLDAIRERIKERGWFSIIWTTYNHLKPLSEVRKDQVLRWMGRDEEPTLKDVVGYLKEVRRYQPWVLEGATLLEPAHTKEGVMLRIKHAPMPKYRLLFVLSEPFVFATRATNPRKAIEEWKARYAGVSEVLGAAFDRSCVDPSRLMFTARHPGGAEGWQIEVLPGTTLNIDEIEPVDPKRMKQVDAGDAFDRAAAEIMGVSGDIKTPWLKRWLAINAESFDAESFWRDKGVERKPRSNGPGCHFKCPNDGNHSNPDDDDDNAFFVVSGPDNTEGAGYQARCMHDSCSGLDRGQMLDLFIQEHGLSERDLEPYIANAVERDGAAKPFEPPHPYKRQGDRFGVIVGEDDNAKFVALCDAFDVVGITSDEHGRGAGKVLRFKNRAGATVEMTVADRRLHDDAAGVRADLVDAGLWVSVKKARDFDEFLSVITAPRRVVTASVPGWHDTGNGRAFVLPTGSAVGADGWRLREGSAVANTEARGSFEAWQAAACELAELNDHWGLSLASAFAGVVVQLAELDSCGFMLTGLSSGGKTTAQELAASAWASPRAGQGVLHTLRTTANAVENLATKSTGTVLCLDELRNLPPKELGAFIMTLAGGVGKSRQTKTSDLRRVASWQTFYVLSSERSARQIMEAAGDRYLNGHAVRLVDVSIDGAKRIDADRFKRLQSVIRGNYGHAGARFVTWLIESGVADDPNAIADRVHRAAKQIAGEDGKASDMLARSARVFGVLGVAASLAEEAGVITLEAHDAIGDALERAWARYAVSSEAASVDPVEEAVEALQAALNARRGVDVVDIAREHQNREAVAYYGPKFVWVRKDHIDTLAGGKVGAASVVKRLHETGALVAPDFEKDRRLYLKYLPGVGRMPVYQLDAEKIGFNMLESDPVLDGLD